MHEYVDTELFDAEYFDQALEQHPQILKQFTEILNASRKILENRFLEGRAASELIFSYAQLVDALLIRVWQLFITNTKNCSLLAVGGYGRGELHPHSDVDIMILVRNEKDTPQNEIEKFITFLWDMHLDIGQSVRTPSECKSIASDDITVATNIQESRLLIGALDLFETQKKLCDPSKIWNSKKFFNAKWQEQKNRHQKFNDTAYNLEPNIKEGPGGLRDIQIISWVTKRHFGTENLEQLVDHNFLTPQELKKLLDGQSFLWKIRYGLHYLGKRREDRLLFDHQRTLAKLFGYQDDKNKSAVEHFMKQYYRTIMELSRLNEMLLQLFQEEIIFSNTKIKTIRINSRFNVKNGFLEVAHEQIFTESPSALLEIFLIQAQHPELDGIRANTIRLIRQHNNLIDNNFRNDPKNQSLFMEILRQRAGVTHELRRMNTYGILAAYIPDFGSIVGQMQHDLFHVYTVDQHTLFVVRNLRRYTVAEFSNEFPMCSEIIRNLAKQEILLIAGIFHDIAKGRGGDHSKLGAKIAFNFCQLHGLSKYDSELVAWLVLNHLVMSSTAQRKDINDLDIIREFADDVGDLYRLDMLFLLTVSDIRATSPKVWNSWKYSLLRSLYYSTKKFFSEQALGKSSGPVSVQRIKYDVISSPELTSYNQDKITTHWNNLSNDYFFQYNYPDIIWHTKSILDSNYLKKPVVQIHETINFSGTEVLIFSKDLFGLLSLITAIFEQLSINVVNARIFKTENKYTLATFIILEQDGEPISEHGRLDLIVTKIKSTLVDPDSSSLEITRSLSRQTKHFSFPTDVLFSQDKNKQTTIMEVIAFDQPGMLSRICASLDVCGVELQAARISTYGERANDIFYITDKQSTMLSDKTHFTCLKQAIIEALDY